MKKFLFAMMALVGIIVCSCSNDDIEISSTGKLHNVYCSVNTRSMYEEFGIEKALDERILAIRGAAVGVMMYLYDSEGKLIDSYIAADYTLNNANYTFEGLPDGEYTILTIEMLVNPDEDNKPYNWSVSNTENIRDIRINQHHHQNDWYSVIGVANHHFVMNDKDETISLVSKGIGRLISFDFVNAKYVDYEEEGVTYECDKVGVGTEIVPIYYRLDPSINDKDRVYFDPNQKGLFNLRGYCDILKDTPDDEIQDNELIIYVLESSFDYSIKFHILNYKDNKTWTGWDFGKYELENKWYYGGFYYANKIGSPCGGLFEKYGDWLEFIEEVKLLNVEESSNLFFAPYTDWSVGSVKAVRDYMSNYSTSVAPTFNNNVLTYVNNENTEEYSYHFATAINGLTEVDYSTTQLNLSAITDYLSQTGYDFIYNDENGYTFVSEDETTVAYVSEFQDGARVRYVPALTESVRRAPKLIRRPIKFNDKRILQYNLSKIKTAEAPTMARPNENKCR